MAVTSLRFLPLARVAGEQARGKPVLRARCLKWSIDRRGLAEPGGTISGEPDDPGIFV